MAVDPIEHPAVGEASHRLRCEEVVREAQLDAAGLIELNPEPTDPKDILICRPLVQSGIEITQLYGFNEYIIEKPCIV